MSGDLSAPPESPPALPSCWRRWRRIFILFVAASFLLYCFHLSLFRGAACALISEDPPAPVTHVAWFHGDGRFEQAAQLFRSGDVRRVLLVEGKTGRMAGIQGLPSPISRDQQALHSRGVPLEAIEVIPANALSEWDSARALGGWLRSHPEATLLILTNRFSSRRSRHILTSELDDDVLGRVQIRALADRNHDETNWWRRKEGLLDFFNNTVHLGYTNLFGETSRPQPDWDADTYESGLR